MAAPKRTPIQRARDRVEIARRYCHGETQIDIAAYLEVSQQQISYDLKAVQREWKDQRIKELDIHKWRELAKIDELERTYWDAWMRSQTEHVRTRSRQQTGGDILASIERENPIGDPRFLVGVAWCIERRCKLLGLDEPLRIDITDRLRELALAAGLDPDEAEQEAKSAVRAAESIMRNR